MWVDVGGWVWVVNTRSKAKSQFKSDLTGLDWNWAWPLLEKEIYNEFRKASIGRNDCCSSQSGFGQSTGNNVSVHKKQYYFLFFYFLFFFYS